MPALAIVLERLLGGVGGVIRITCFPLRAVFLAISGGGDDGAFGAGFLNSWTIAGSHPQFKIDGKFQPDYVLGLVENLAKAMGLDVTVESTKDLTLLPLSPKNLAIAPEYHPVPVICSDELGTLCLYRYWNLEFHHD
ncbi:hypothetical protein NONS58_05910 [Nitrosococcus oceani]|nr:hypothetical protein NONS58_05910 [Nitrosococcus oceani]